jgi:hypothetical protein
MSVRFHQSARQLAIFALIAGGSLVSPAAWGVELGITLYQEPASPSKSPALWGVAGKSMELTLDVNGPIGWAGQLEGTLFQATDELAAPLPGGKLDLGNIRFDNATTQKVPVSIPLPESEKGSKIVVRFSLREAADDAASAQYAVMLGVFPDTDSPGNPIRRLKQIEDGGVIIRGESSRLRAFFESHAILSVDAEDGRAGSVVLYEGEEPPRPAQSGARVLWFAPPDTLLPGVYPQASGITKITLPLPAQLAGNPLAQNTLATLILQNLSPTNP